MVNFIRRLRRSSHASCCAMVALAATAMPASAALVTDTFNRASSNNLGLTSDATQTWIENESSVADRIQIISDGVNQVAQFNSRGSGSDPGATLNVSAKDVEITVRMKSWLASDNYFGGIMYRLNSTGRFFADGQPGYRVMVTPSEWTSTTYLANTVTLTWGGNVILESEPLPASINYNQEYELKVVANGDNHKIFWDGVEVLNFDETTTGRDVAGVVGLGSYYGNWQYRNFEVNAVPEPSSAAILILLPSLALAGRRMRRAAVEM
jgi:hypothetical protein